MMASMAPDHIQPRTFQPDTRQVAVFGTGVFFMVITSIVMALRLYTRTVITKGLGMDDGKFRLQGLHALTYSQTS